MNTNAIYKQSRLTFTTIRLNFSRGFLSKSSYVTQLTKLLSRLKSTVTPSYSKGLFNPIGEAQILLREITAEVNKFRVSKT